MIDLYSSLIMRLCYLSFFFFFSFFFLVDKFTISLSLSLSLSGVEKFVSIGYQYKVIFLMGPTNLC